jgi:transposase InsO family protein
MVLGGVVPLGVKPKTSSAHKQAVEPQTAPQARRNLLKERGVIAGYLHHVWAEDFTHIWFQGRWYYLATVIDLYSRQVVGWALSAHHDTDLITAALLDALSRHQPPAICHQDQGSEYCSERYDIIALSQGIELSFSEKGSPWENGFQESFYRPFKLEIGAKKLDRFVDLGALSEAIAKHMQYYNTERIHSALRMTPLAFAVSGLPPRNTTKHQKLYGKQHTKKPTVLQQILTGVRDRVSGILGA